MKIIKDTISYAENMKVTIGGEEIKGIGKDDLGFCNIAGKRLSEDYHDSIKDWEKSLEDLKFSGEMSFTGTFKHSTFNDYIDDYGLCEFDYIEEDIGFYIENELFCRIDCGFKKDTPGTFYFLGVSEKEEGTYYNTGGGD